MTKEEAVNVLKTRSCYECSCGCYSPVSCSCGGCDLTEATEIAIELLEQPKWIPVTERFPKEGDSYIIYHESFGIRIDMRINGEWKTYGDDTVLAWMPLPEPYSREDDR